MGMCVYAYLQLMHICFIVTSICKPLKHSYKLASTLKGLNVQYGLKLYLKIKFDKGCYFAKGRLTAFIQLIDLILV